MEQTALGQIAPYLVVIGVALVWALAEILQSFPGDMRRAILSPWTALFVLGNIAFALLAYFPAQALLANLLDRLTLAVVAGLGWQALLRTRIHLLQPLSADVAQPVSVSLADLYGRFQGFCRQGIDQTLLLERRNLLSRLTVLSLERLEEEVLLMGYASALGNPADIRRWLEEMKKYPDEERRLYLAHRLLRTGGFDYLRRLIQMLEKERRK